MNPMKNVVNRDEFFVSVRVVNMIAITHRTCALGAKLGGGGRAIDLVGKEGRSFRLESRVAIFARELLRRRLYPRR